MHSAFDEWLECSVCLHLKEEFEFPLGIGRILAALELFDGKFFFLDETFDSSGDESSLLLLKIPGC